MCDNNAKVTATLTAVETDHVKGALVGSVFQYQKAISSDLDFHELGEIVSACIESFEAAGGDMNGQKIQISFD